MVVAQQDAGQDPGLGQDLEAVARAEHRAAGRGERLDRAHHRREARDRAGAQVVAVGEAAGQDHGVGAAKIVVGVPHETRLPAEDGFGNVREVALGPGPGKDRHRHARAPTRRSRVRLIGILLGVGARSSQVAVSMTGLASRRRHISSTAASAAARSGASKAMRISLPLLTSLTVG